MSPAKRPRPRTSGGSSSRSTDWPIQLFVLPREAGEGDRAERGGGGAELTASPLSIERLRQQFHPCPANRPPVSATLSRRVAPAKRRDVRRVLVDHPCYGLFHLSRSRGAPSHNKSREHTDRLDVGDERLADPGVERAGASIAEPPAVKAGDEGGERFQISWTALSSISLGPAPPPPRYARSPSPASRGRNALVPSLIKIAIFVSS